MKFSKSDLLVQTRLKAALVLALFWGTPFLSYAQVEMSISKSCQAQLTPGFLSQIKNLVDGNGTIRVALFGELGDSLNLNQTSPKFLSNIQTLYQAVKETEIEDSVLSHTFQNLPVFLENRTLGVCALEGECVLPGDAGAIHVSSFHQPKYSIVEGREFQKIQEGDFWTTREFEARRNRNYTKRNSREDIVIIDTSFLSTGDSQDLLARATSIETVFIHELVHVVDVVLLSTWVNANLELLKKNKDPDPMFSVFAKVLDSGVVVLSEVFVRFFTETRAYFSMLPVVGFFQSDFDIETLRKDLGYMIWEEYLLKDTKGMDHPIFDFFDLPKPVSFHDLPLVERLLIVRRLHKLTYGEESIQNRMLDTVKRAFP